MPPRMRERRASLREILRGYGLAPAQFQRIIDRAIRRRWTPEEFEARVYLSKPFRRKFPGIFRDDGSLRMSVDQYRQMSDAYKKIAGDFGVQVDDARIGRLIAGQVSPDEWNERAQVYRAATSSEGQRKAFNEIRAAQGLPTLDQVDWFDTLAGTGTAALTEQYEAAAIRASGLDISAEEAIGVGGQVSAYGEIANISELVAEVKQYKGFVQSELSSAGISDADLTVLAANVDPKNQRFALERIVRQRRALAQAGGTVTPRRGAPGRVALFGAEQEGA